MRPSVWASKLMSHPKGSNRVGCMRTNSWGEFLDAEQEVTADRTIPHDDEAHNPSPLRVRGMRCADHVARAWMRSA